jgi:hypothetical protein
VRLVATNEGGEGVSAEPNPSFTTPAAAPTIVSTSATFGATGATLHAEVNPNGADTTYRFEYGPTESYGTSVPVPDRGIGSGTSPDSVAQSITGLAANAEYHYRVVATNSVAPAGVNGPDETLRTFPTPTSGLPDGRHYEEVTPTIKHGPEAGAENVGEARYVVSSANGSKVVFQGTGPIGQTNSGDDVFSVAERDPDGPWVVHAAVPRPEVGGQLNFGSYSQAEVFPSPDFSQIVFGTTGPFFSDQPGPETSGIYRTGAKAGGLVSWVNEPTTESPLPAVGANGAMESDVVPVGGSPDFESFDFAFSGLLVPEDEPRRPYVGNGVESSAWGFYEWNASTNRLVSAGILPNGVEGPFGAVPARYRGPFSKQEGLAGEELDDSQGQLMTPASSAGDIVESGKQIYFVSPDPLAVQERLTDEPPQLYLRRDGQPGILVSRQEDGQPAPHGPAALQWPAYPTEEGNTHVVGTSGEWNNTYVYAAANGERSYFASIDSLTADAPANTELKTYKYEARTNTVSYVPGVQGAILASSEDGKRLIFDDYGHEQLDLWAELADGKGRVTPVVPHLPTLASGIEVPVTHATPDGSVFVFETNATLPGANSGGFQQVYRYDADAASPSVECLSCPPRGVTPTGNAVFSRYADSIRFLTASRGMNEAGSEVFFDTPDPLVTNDVNGKRDVYEWENGHVYLVSSGSGEANSYYDDNSESGEDVFFATADGLAPGDPDGGYDIYDARVGSAPSAPAPPPACSSECQGPAPPSPASSSPASLATSGSGNLAAVPPLAPVKVASKPLTRSQMLLAALKKCEKDKKKSKRAACERAAGHKYGPAKKKVRKAARERASTDRRADR